MQLYDSEAVGRLAEKLAYETRLLEALSDAAGLAEGGVDPAEVRLRGSRGGAVVGAQVSIMVSDSVGAGAVVNLVAQLSPFAFVASHKILDSVVEWVLEENCRVGLLPKVPWEYQRRAQEIARTDLTVPVQFAHNPWLMRVAFALYVRLIPFRNEVIHGSSFAVRAGGVEITDTKSPCRWRLALSKQQLGSLFRFSVGVGRTLTASEYLDKYREKLLKFHSDQLRHVHGEPAFNQAEPLLTKVVVEIDEGQGAMLVDLGYVRAKLQKIHPGRETVFNLRVEGFRDGELVGTKEFPYEVVPNGDSLTLRLEELDGVA